MLWFNLPRINVTQITYIITRMICGRLSRRVGRVSVHGEFHRLAGVNCCTRLQVVFKSLIIENLHRHKIRCREPGQLIEAASVDACRRFVSGQVVKKPSAEVVYMQSGALAFFELERYDAIRCVDVFDKTKRDRVPQLAANDVDAIKTQLRNFEKISKPHTSEPAVSVLVDPAATA